MHPDSNYSIDSLLMKGQLVGHPKDMNLEIPPLTFDYAEPPQYVRSLNIPLSASAEIEMEADINVPLLRRFTGVDLAKGSDMSSCTMVFSQPYQEQIRRHKKKRINKKWAKRYGYRTKFKKYRISEVSFMNNGFEFEATGRNMEVLR